MKNTTLLSKLILSLILTSFTFVLSSQSGTISGTVSDIDGPLIGATVLIVGTAQGTTTEVDGSYTLSIEPGNYTLQASYTGYESQDQSVSVSAAGQTQADFRLSQGLLLGDIVVTGTRSNPRTTLSSPVPIDNFTSEIIEQHGNGDITEVLKNIVPSFNATALTGDGAAFVRSTSLRGLPPDEILVLVNSKRRHRSSLIAHFGAAMNVGAHAVDVGNIPGIAVKNLEVLRDGAAAQYGSDAIAGVMNFILKDANKGVEVQAQTGKWYGNANEGVDAHSETDYKVGINFGLPLTKKGFINISGEYSFNEELSRGVQHAAAMGVEGAQNPAMNWGRPESSGFRTVWNAGIEIAENVEFYSFGNYADTYGNYSFFYRQPNRSGVLIPLPNNPQQPSEGNFCWCDIFPAGFTPRLEGFQTDFSSVSGIRGSLGGGINYDISTSFGNNRINYLLLGSLNPSWGPLSQTNFEGGDIQQDEKNFNVDLSKELNDRVNLAIGFQTRKETYTLHEGDYQSWAPGPWAGVSALINPETGANYASPGIGANGLSGIGPDAAGIFEGKSWGTYIDLEYDITDALLVQGAFRHESYDDFGTTDNYKLAARYTAANWLTLRGGYSTGFRAPTPGQANVVTITTSFDGVTGMQVQEGTVSPTSPLAVSLGGKALVPETSKNLSIGLASRLNSNFSITLDLYSIEVSDRIIKSRSLPIVNPLFSELAFYTNSLNTETTGLDAVLSWRSGGTNVSLAYNYNKTEVVSQSQVGGQDPVSAGTIFNLENNLPKSKATLSVNHNIGSFSGMIRALYYGGTIDERGDQEVVSAATIIDLELGYQATDNVRFTLGANNVLDTYPDKIETRISQGMPYPRRTPIGYHGGMVYFKVIYKI